MPDEARIARRSGWLERVRCGVGGAACRRLFRLRVEGHDHVPLAGGAIIAANHLSFFDSVALALAVPRPLRFVGKAEYMDSWKTRRLFPALGMVPIERYSPRQAYRALQVVADVLDDHQLFAVYPEGTRSADGALGDGHSGVGQLSVMTGAPIIPTGIVGTDRIQPRGARLPRPFRSATVRFGAPIDPGDYDGNQRARRRQITSDVMSAIGRLSGQSPEPSTSEKAPADPAPVGESLHISERVVVSPAAGSFMPLVAVGTDVDADQVIGRVCAGADVVDIRTPFAGRLISIVAWEGERLERFQRVAWLRAA